MYHMLSNALSDYIVSPLSEYVISPLLNFVGNWGGRTVVNFIADNGGRAVLNFVGDWGGRATVNAALNNPHAVIGTGVALAGAKWAYDKGHTPKAALTSFQNYRNKKGDVKNSGQNDGALNNPGAAATESRGRTDSPEQVEKPRSRSASPKLGGKDSSNE